jgi:hypothetical protein
MYEVTRGWRKLHNEELHDLYSAPSIIRMIKSRRMRWVWHVARMGYNRNAYRLLVGKPEGKRPLDLDLYRSISLSKHINVTVFKSSLNNQIRNIKQEVLRPHV